MSTRATYRFTDQQESRWTKPTTTIYIHSDGYPAGAAWYFYLTLINPSHGDMATQFIRANERAEITHSHESHGDTEYRYDIAGSGPLATIECRKRHGYGFGDEGGAKWNLGTAIMPMKDFIEKQIDQKWCTDVGGFHPFKEVQLDYSKCWLNLQTAKIRLENTYGPLHHLRVWSENQLSENSCNWKGQVACLRGIIDVFPELRTEEVNKFLQEKK